MPHRTTDSVQFKRDIASRTAAGSAYGQEPWHMQPSAAPANGRGKSFGNRYFTHVREGLPVEGYSD
jgi:UDP-galactopyranose mutase